MQVKPVADQKMRIKQIVIPISMYQALNTAPVGTIARVTAADIPDDLQFINAMPDPATNSMRFFYTSKTFEAVDVIEMHHAPYMDGAIWEIFAPPEDAEQPEDDGEKKTIIHTGE